MPSFKPYTRERTIPGVSGSVKGDLYSPEGDALQGVSKAIGYVGDVVSARETREAGIIAKHQEKLRLQDIFNRELTIKAAYNDQERAFKTDEQSLTGQDSYDNLTRADEFTKKATETLLKDVTDDDLKNKINQYVFNRSQRLKDSLSVHQVAQREVVRKSASDNILNGLLKDSYSGGELEDFISEWDTSIKGQHDVGSLGTQDAEDHIVSGHSAIAEAYIDGIIDRDPLSAITDIESGKFNRYLPQDKIEEYDKKAKKMSKAIGEDYKRKENEAARVAKEKKAELQNKIGDDFIHKLVVGTLSETEVLSSKLDPTGKNSKEHWIKQLKIRNKKTTKDTWVTNKEVEAKIFTKITENPNSITDIEIAHRLGNGLSTEDATALISYRKTRLGKDDDPLKSEQAKAAIKRISDAKTGYIFSRGDKSREGKMANSKKWAESTVLLKKFIQNNPDEDPSDFVDKLMEPIETSFVDSFFEFFQPGTTDTLQEQRKKELEREAGVTEFDKWLKKAKEVNNGVSEEELTDYYNKTYGAK